MRKIPLYDITKNFDNLESIYAHLNDTKEDETLFEHLNKTVEYFYKISEIKGIEDCLTRIIQKIFLNGRVLNSDEVLILKEMFINAVYLHDIGKINPAFQKIKMGSKKIETELPESDHSLLSSLIYIDIFTKKVREVQDKRVRKFIEYMLYLNAYCISKHHTYLKNLDSFISDIEVLQRRVTKKPEYIKYYLSSTIDEIDFSQDRNSFYARNSIQKKEDYPYTEVYILLKLLYSSIVSADFYATYDYMNSKIYDFGVIKDIELLRKEYENSEIYKSINKYKIFLNGQIDVSPYGDNSINQLRTEIFLESEGNLLENLSSNIFYLEAPTGSGKTNTSINLALKILENDKNINKIFYIFPFNSLIEQTKKTLSTLFKDSESGIAEINSITPIMTNEENLDDETIGSINYEKHLLNRQFLHYPIVLTSHINFFNYLFGTGKEAHFPLIHLCNSVIIIDEIQSYRNDIWKEIIMLLDKYAESLNMKIIIMSATLPKLDNLISKDKTSSFVELIKDKQKYYNHELFRNRVMLNYDLLEIENITIDYLVSEVEKIWDERKKSRILIEFITRTDAREFYNKFKEQNPNKLIYELTGDDNKLLRKRILDLLKKKENGEYTIKDVLIVATQVIEAGVDIDMDVGLKDISILDSEEQFLGRINRSCERVGYAYFFNLTNPRLIYRNDHRIDMNLLNPKYQKALEMKDFQDFYGECFSSIEYKKNQLNEHNIENLIEELRTLQFNNIFKRLELIIDKNYQIYLPHTIEDGEEEIDGRKIWGDYKNIIDNKNMGYAEKKIKLSQIYEKLNLFMYNIRKEPRTRSDQLGNIYYIENGEEFITDGKFDRTKFRDVEEGLFL